MKYIQFIAICLILLLSGSVQAQMPAGRTKATIVADALAQLPADTQQKYNQTIADLVSTGEEGLLDLIGRMNPPGNKSNETVEYAISGWTHFVANDAVKRELAANAFGKALNKQLDKEVKAFIIRQLRTICKDSDVNVLSGFLTDEQLSSPASLALVSIGTEKAGAALLKALKTTNSETIQLNLVNALGQLKYVSAEADLLNLLNRSNSEKTQKDLLNALAHLGTKESLKALRNKAEAQQYAYDKTNATESYLSLLKQLNVLDAKMVQKEAKKLLAIATKQNKQDLKVAAVRLLLAQPNAKKDALLKEALADGNIAYISGVLNSCSFEKDAKSVALIQKTVATTKQPGVQTALIYWLAKHQVEGSDLLAAKLINSSEQDGPKGSS